MKIDRRHPRYDSLIIREKLVWGVKQGITSAAGLIAHGRGEAFDYLLGEKTHEFGMKAIRAAAAMLLLAKKPVLSINGNCAALVPDDFIKIARLLNCKIEVNLFHFSQKRVRVIEAWLKKIDKERVLVAKHQEKIKIAQITSKRVLVIKDGIFESDCILVPLEDGDRCEALTALGKKVITVDLNPLSRTASAATVTIVDNIVRALPQLAQEIKNLKDKDKRFLEKIIEKYDNKQIREQALKTMRKNKN